MFLDLGKRLAVDQRTLRDAGVSPARARRLATLAVAGVTGDVVLARAERSTRPLQDVGTELEMLLKAALVR